MTQAGKTMALRGEVHSGLRDRSGGLAAGRLGQQRFHEITQPQEIAVLRRFPKIAPRPEFGHLLAIVTGIRGRDDDHEGVRAAAALPEVTENVVSVAFGKIDVEKDKLRTGRRGIELGLLKETDGFLPVRHDVNIGVYLRHAERFANQKHVGPVVLHHQNRGPLLCGVVRPGW